MLALFGRTDQLAHSTTLTCAVTPIFARSACSNSAESFGSGFSTLPVGRVQIVVVKPFG